MNASWIPDEPAEVLLNERTWLAGIILTAVGYGVVLALFIMCFRILTKNISRHNRMQRLPMLIYVSLMFFYGTIYVAAGAKMTQLSFIDYRLFPGGPCRHLFQWKCDGL